VGKEGCTSDPFSIRDGHYVGHDGFVVPRDFAEFNKRFPDYVHRRVSKHASTSASREGIEDWTQDLLVHLSRLPETSKHRDAGRQDIVATFNPLRHYDANEARFRNYINLCLANKVHEDGSTGAVLDGIEKSPDHQIALKQAPLRGHAHDYLRALDQPGFLVQVE
jgi:hypothetical protein